MLDETDNTAPAMADDDPAPRADGRFQKGRSGNPKGRPKRVAAPADDDVREKVLGEVVAARIDGRVRKMTIRELVMRQLVKRCVDGDPRAIALLMQPELRLSKKALAQIDQGMTPEQEDALLERFVARQTT
jgi:hypothetical protein